MLDFAAEHAVAWRLALDLATEMIMTPPLDRYAGRLVKEAREDFGAIVASVDLNMTPAVHAPVQGVPPGRHARRLRSPGIRPRRDCGRHDLLAASLVTHSAKPATPLEPPNQPG